MGGQPSTTQPSAGPWLSPNVVTRKRWPKVLCDMIGPRGRLKGAMPATSNADVRRLLAAAESTGSTRAGHLPVPIPLHAASFGDSASAGTPAVTHAAGAPSHSECAGIASPFMTTV